MATNYPAALDAFPDQPTLAAHLLSTDTHSRLHGDIGDAIRAIETYAGTSANPAAGTITYRLNQVGTVIVGTTSELTPLRDPLSSSDFTVNAGDLVYEDYGLLHNAILPASPVDKTLVAITTARATQYWVKPGGTDAIVGVTPGGYLSGNGFASRQGVLLQYQATLQQWLVFSYLDYETNLGNTFVKIDSPVWTYIGEYPIAPAWATTGLTGATTTSRWVGTVDGADPSSGTFSVGDYVVDRTLGGFRIYTAAGWRTVAPAGRTGAFRPITATATLDDGDYIVAADSTGGAITVNLPTAVGLTGKEYRIKRTSSGANDVTIDPNASETVDGATTLTLSSQWDVARIVSDGANWLRF